MSADPETCRADVDDDIASLVASKCVASWCGVVEYNRAHAPTLAYPFPVVVPPSPSSSFSMSSSLVALVAKLPFAINCHGHVARARSAPNLFRRILWTASTLPPEAAATQPMESVCAVIKFVQSRVYSIRICFLLRIRHMVGVDDWFGVKEHLEYGVAFVVAYIWVMVY